MMQSSQNLITSFLIANLTPYTLHIHKSPVLVSGGLQLGHGGQLLLPRPRREAGQRVGLGHGAS